MGSNSEDELDRFACLSSRLFPLRVLVLIGADHLWCLVFVCARDAAIAVLPTHSI